MANWDVVGGVAIQWLDRSPSGSTSTCDSCHRDVPEGRPRLRVDDGRGRHRVGGKGKTHTYLCETCGDSRVRDLAHYDPSECSRCRARPPEGALLNVPTINGDLWWCLSCMEATAGDR